MIRTFAAVTLSIGIVVATAGAAAAEGQVGTPGTPTCYGERVSTGNQITFEEEGTTFRLTPVTRAMFNGISVQGFHNKVWASCHPAS
jgi:hypothetical protein